VTLSRRWTSKEIAFLAANGDLGAEEVARELGRSLASVKCTAYRFGVSLRRKPPLCPVCCLRPIRTASGICRVCSLRRQVKAYKAETARRLAAWEAEQVKVASTVSSSSTADAPAGRRGTAHQGQRSRASRTG